MPKLSALCLCLIFLLQSAAAQAKLCRNWGDVKTEGTLDRKSLPEASGLGVSLRYPGRYYWVNDSGNKDVLYHTSISGKNLKAIKLTGTRFRDTEALTVTNCGDDSCLIVGDTGNNNLKKRNAVLWIFKEKDLDVENAKLFRKVEFTFPGGEYDVEAMTALPDGRLLFITKEMTLDNLANPRLFVLEKSQWLEGTGFPEAKKIGVLPIKQWLPDKGFLGQAVTDAAYNSERDVIGLLTYSALVETPLPKLKDFNEARVWREGDDYSLVPIKALNQQEAMAYDHKGNRVIWSSEFLPPDTPIYSLTCERAEY